ncbi:MAG: tetratricopeptide repeat protein [Proteobacteria bacterium]|nr:tetratricopeptide repeat protein [Pseudomonadota bacterium]
MAARYIDMNIFAFTGAIGFAFLSPGTENPVVEQWLYAVVAMASCILLEPVVLAMFGGTPGKAILNISMESKIYPSIQTVPVSELLKRTFQVYFFGLGLGLFLIVAPFFFMFKDYKIMKQTGFTRWDRACGTQVSFGGMGVFRFLVGATLVLSFMTLNLVGKSLNRAERKEWYAAKYHSGERTQVSPDIPKPMEKDNSNNDPDELDLFKKYGVKPSNAVQQESHDSEPTDAQTQFAAIRSSTLKPYTGSLEGFVEVPTDAQTQFNLGMAYAKGESVPRNIAEAVKWFRMAAMQGHAEAQFSLGLLYHFGHNQGIHQNYAETAKWWLMAAEQGDAKAQSALAQLYEDGHGVLQNYAEAAKWYLMAANQGYAEAQFSIGVLYIRGVGVQQNPADAAMWWRMAANQGYASAQSRLGLAYYLGLGVPQNYSEATKWLRLAADQGNALAQYGLGGAYENGQGVPQNYAEAAKWYRLAAAQGDEKAQAALNSLGSPQ